MKKIVILLGALILSVLSFAEERTAYVLVPSDLDLKDIKITGIVEGSNNEIHVLKDVTGESNSLPKLEDLGENIGVVVQDSSISSYGSTKYIEVVVANVEKTDNVKFVMGYPVGGKDIPTYAVIASDDIKTSTVGTNSLKDIFDSETRDMENLLVSTDFTYDTFPGKELQNDIRISGIVVGQDIMDESEIPSNIVDLYTKEGGELEDTINKVSGGADINPNNSNTNSEFELWAVKTDANGDVVPKVDEDGNVVYKKNQDGTLAVDEDGEYIPESERVLLYTSKDSGDEDPEYGDLRSIVPIKQNGKYNDGETPMSYGESLYVGDPSAGDPYTYFMYDIDVRFKQGGTIKINDGDVGVGAGTGNDKFKWQFYNVKDVVLTFNKNGFYFGLSGDEVGVVPPDGTPDDTINLPLSEEFYAIDDDGGLKDMEADIISKYTEATKYRKSSVNMKVITESGEDNFEIETISE